MMDASENARKIAEKSTAETREAIKKVSAASEETTRRLESSMNKAAQGARDFQRKILEITRANIEAAFDCAQDLVEVTSPFQFVEVTSHHARERVAAMSEQTRELAELAQKAARYSFAPLMSGGAGASRAMS
jgi:phasin